MCDPGRVFGGWYLLRTVPRSKSPGVCAQKGRPQAKGPLPSADLKQVRAGLPLPIGPSLSPWDGHFCPKDQVRAKIWNCLPPGTKRAVWASWMGTLGNKRCVQPHLRAGCDSGLAECCLCMIPALALPSILCFVFFFFLYKIEVENSIFPDFKMLTLTQTKTEKTSQWKANKACLGPHIFHPRKVHVHRTLALYSTRRNVEAQAECIASGNIELMSTLGAGWCPQ